MLSRKPKNHIPDNPCCRVSLLSTFLHLHLDQPQRISHPCGFLPGSLKCQQELWREGNLISDFIKAFNILFSLHGDDVSAINLACAIIHTCLIHTQSFSLTQQSPILPRVPQKCRGKEKSEIQYFKRFSISVTRCFTK